MVAKLTRLTHKIAIQLHLVAESCTFAVFAPGGQSGNFGYTLVSSWRLRADFTVWPTLHEMV